MFIHVFLVDVHKKILVIYFNCHRTLFMGKRGTQPINSIDHHEHNSTMADGISLGLHF